LAKFGLVVERSAKYSSSSDFPTVRSESGCRVEVLPTGGATTGLGGIGGTDLGIAPVLFSAPVAMFGTEIVVFSGPVDLFSDKFCEDVGGGLENLGSG